MKNFIYVKIKTFLGIFLSINLIMQPFSISFYVINHTDASNVLQHTLVGLYLSFSLSFIINEYIFRTIFYKMLKGKLISNYKGSKMILLQSFMLVTLLFIWASFFAVQSHVVIYPLFIIILCFVNEANQTYIISNGFLFCGFTVIPLEAIHWYKISKKRRPTELSIRYSGHRIFKSTNSAQCLEQLTTYFATHNISEKLPENYSGKYQNELN